MRASYACHRGSIVSSKRKWGVRGATFVLACLLAQRASAACENPCEAELESSIITPPLECVSVQAVIQECDCAVRIAVKNACVTSLEAVGFAFDRCSSEGEPLALTNCSSLPPAEQGRLEIALTERGEQRWPMELRTGGASYTLTTTTRVRSFADASCVCGMPTARSQPLSGALVGWLLLAGLAVARRR